MTSGGERVFLHTSDLAERWASLKISNFTLGEIGFGCGLNFLYAWSQWLKLAAKDGRLDFVCIDKHPLSRREIGQALAAEAPLRWAGPGHMDLTTA